MLKCILSRALHPSQVQLIRTISKQQKQMCCLLRRPNKYYLNQPIYRHYAVDLDEEIARLKIQHIPNQEIHEATDEHMYDILNVRVLGYDCSSVEHFAQYLHGLAKRLDINVPDSYAVQTKSTLVHTLQSPGEAEANKVEDFILKTHERIIQLQDLSTTSAPLFLDMVQTNMPEGVDIKVELHSQMHYKDRFVRKEIPEHMIK